MNVLPRFRNICFLLFLTVFSAFAQGYEITVTVKNLTGPLILGHYYVKNDGMYSDDTTVLDKAGKGVFKGNKKLAPGLYFLYTGHSKFDILIGNDAQRFSISTDTLDFINKTQISGSVDNQVFFDFQKFNAERGTKFMQLNEQIQVATTDGEKNKIYSEMQALQKERLDYLQKQIDTHPGLYVSKFLTTLVPIETKVPEPPRNAAGQITDSSYVYRWYRVHFFDDLNIFDPDMLRVPFYEDKLMKYITEAIPQYPDTICAEADKILAKAKANDDIFRVVLVTLFNHYVQSNIMVHENVWVHLADKWYIPYGSFGDNAKYISDLKKQVELKKPNLIGNYAPPMEQLMSLPPDHFKAAPMDTAIKFDLHAGTMINDFRKTVKAKYTAILFWDYSCSHCKKVIIDLHKVYEEYKDKGLQVITVQTVVSKEAKGKWIDYVNENDLLDWINAWSPYNAKYRDLYDISQTPIIYLLDENDKIIAKKLVPEQFKDFLDHTTK